MVVIRESFSESSVLLIELAAIVVRDGNPARVLADHVIPEGLAVPPNSTTAPGQTEADGEQKEQRSGQYGSHAALRCAGWFRFVQPPTESKEESDVGDIGEPVRDDGRAHRYDLQDQGQIDDEESQAKHDR